MTTPGEPERALRLAELLTATDPAARADRGPAPLPVLPQLAGLLPDGGLRPGTVVECPDYALLLALAAGPMTHRPDSWACLIGLGSLGLAAADGHGLALDHVLLVEEPGELWPEVVSTMASAVDQILLAPSTPLTPTTARRLEARLRQHGTVLLTPAHWPGAQLRLEVESHGWAGLGQGWGQLAERRVTVRTGGRGRGLGRSAELLLPDSSGSVTALTAADARQPAPQTAPHPAVPGDAAAAY